jgi:hypothetical protein
MYQERLINVFTLRRLPRWVWFNGAAVVCGVLPVILAWALHNRTSASDPAGLRHQFTLVQTAGPGILGFVGAPLLIGLVLPVPIYLKLTRRSHFADRVAWSLAVLSCLIGLLGLVTEWTMLPVAVLTVCAVATASAAAE